MIRRVIPLVAAVALSLSLPAAARAQAITEYTLAIYLQGGATPISTPQALPASAFICGQPRVAATSATANPSRIRIEDPAAPTLDCVYADTGTGPLLALPFNPTAVYEVTLSATNTVGTGPASVRSNSFSRPGSVPNAPRLPRVGS